MSDSGGALLGATFIIGLLVLYFVQRRLDKRGAEPKDPEPTMAELGGIVEPEVHYEVNLGIPFVYIMLLVGYTTHRGNFWGYLWESIYFVLVAGAVYFMASPAQFVAEQRRVPGTTRTQYYLRIGVPYVLLPTVAWVVCWAFF